MAKRETGAPRLGGPRDFVPTPPKAAEHLNRFLAPGTRAWEPCAGDGALLRHMTNVHFERAFDLHPRSANIETLDAAGVDYIDCPLIITNPPFARELVTPLLRVWVREVECWLLLPTDYLANKWTAPYMEHLDRIVPLGRVSWLQNGKGGRENFMWAHFSPARKYFVVGR